MKRERGFLNNIARSPLEKSLLSALRRQPFIRVWQYLVLQNIRGRKLSGVCTRGNRNVCICVYYESSTLEIENVYVINVTLGN